MIKNSIKLTNNKTTEDTFGGNRATKSPIVEIEQTFKTERTKNF